MRLTFTILWLSLLIFSCQTKPAFPSPPHSPRTKSIAEKDAANKNYLPPEVKFITADNTPQKLKAGKPIIRIDSSKGGIPFFTRYAAEQGLVSGVVTTSHADEVGNIWFTTTGGGVYRYDGKDFINFTKTLGLGSNVVFTMAEDKGGNFWFGTTSGLTKYDGRHMTNLSLADGLPSTYIDWVLPDSGRTLWVATHEPGVYKYDGKVFTKFAGDQALASSHVLCILKDRQGNLWFGTKENGVIQFDGTHFNRYTSAQGLAANTVQCIIQDKRGNFWFGTNAGLSKFDQHKFSNFTTTQGLTENNVTCLLEDEHGEFWIGTQSGGINRFDGTGFKHYTRTQGLADNNVSGIMEDKKGNIWITSLGGGVSRYLGDCLSSYTTSQGPSGAIVFYITQDKTKNLWLASRETGLIRFDGSAFTQFTHEQGLPGSSLWSVVQDKMGNIWVATNAEGISKFDGVYFTNYTTDQGLVSNRTGCLCVDREGNIWIGTISGVSKFDGNSFTNYTRGSGLPGNNVQAITQDKAGNIWFATHDDGVCSYDGKHFAHYSTLDGLGSNTIYSAITDEAGGVWFATNNGASRFDGRHFTNYTKTEGLADNNVWALRDDTVRQMIWFTNNLGISGLKYHLDQQGNFIAERFENFGTKTGYPIFNLTRSLCLDDRGLLWAGSGDDRVIRFDYSKVNRDREPLSLRIQGVKINNGTICWNSLLSNHSRANRLEDSLNQVEEMVLSFGSILSPNTLDSLRRTHRGIQLDSVGRDYPVPFNLVLPYNDNSISIDYVAIDPGKPNQVKYQYKLDGYDNDWSPLSNVSRAIYGNLPEGDYTLQVKALSAEAAWSQTAYSFRVLPPWQRTWWAYAAYLILLAILVWMIVALRSNVLTRENKMLERKVAERTTALNRSLADLKSTQAQLIQSEKMASLGELTAGIAHEIQNPLNFMNNFSEVNKELLQEMKHEMVAGNYTDAGNIADDVIANEEKVNLHGKRADAIIKGMLEHSRTNKGTREPTNMNALVDEYLQLAFHGFRARDREFNARLEKTFDPGMGEINIIRQDVGRVLLNLFNNAFYAVLEKQRDLKEGYDPLIAVSTAKGRDGISITVRDNGIGIPQKIIDKIFQPFFTTKPTGQGTGLGLSLTYDIMKSHGGEIKVKSVEGEGSEFIVRWPIEV